MKRMQSFICRVGCFVLVVFAYLFLSAFHVSANQLKVEDFLDTDFDGISDKQELIYGTKIRQADSDGDGYTDKEELDNGFDPLNSGEVITEEVLLGNCDRKKGEERVNCIFDSARRLKKYKICEKLGKDNIEPCKARVAGEREELDECYKFKSEEDKSICIIGVAEKKVDSSLCSTVLLEKRDICLLRVSTSAKDQSICALTRNKNARYVCYSYIAGNTGNFGLCEKIQDIGIAGSCFLNVAKKTKNEIICSSIKDIETRNECYFAIAVELRDKEMCDNIISPTYRFECASYFLGDLLESQDKMSYVRNFIVEYIKSISIEYLVIVVVILVLYIFICAWFFHLSMKILDLGYDEYMIVLKSVSFLIALFYMMLFFFGGLYLVTMLDTFLKIGVVFIVLFQPLMYHLVFKKKQNTSLTENTKIFFLSLFLNIGFIALIGAVVYYLATEELLPSIF